MTTTIDTHVDTSASLTGFQRTLKPCPKCGAKSHRCKSGASNCRHCDECNHTWFDRSPQSTAAKAPPTFSDLMFKDTINARMLRTLCERGTMSQADFMREYHRRCERPERPCWTCSGNGKVDWAIDGQGVCRKCNGTGIGKESRSSFVNNLGRFVHSISWGAHETHIYARNVSDDRKPYACIESSYGKSKRTGNPIKNRDVLTWTRGTPDEVLRSLSDAKLLAAFTALERQMLEPRKSDDDQETGRWMLRLRAEMHRRTP